MPDPTRPVAGAPIDTDWGQQIHDRVFQPKGARTRHNTTQTVGTTFTQLAINTADDDPGGWLSSDTLTVASGAGGLYAFWIKVAANDTDTRSFRIEFRVNGTAYGSQRYSHVGEFQSVSFSGLIELSAGDQLEVWARNSSGSCLMGLAPFDLLIQGTSIGA
jgi:hypothetical protein